MQTHTPYNLLHNSRFYILAFSLLLSISVFAFIRLQIPSDPLLLIRTQQVFGFVAIGYLYLALIVSPLGYIIGKERVKHLSFARRAIGVSAFYFALLHGLIALFGQLGGIDQVALLPSLFQWSLLAAVIALCALGLMAMTSFDRVIAAMTFRRWKWLHRLVYTSGVLIILHVWTIGTHLAYAPAQVILFVALVILLGLEIFRITRYTNQRYLRLSRAEAGTVFIALWTILATTLLILPLFIQNYHSRHTSHQSHSQEIKR